MESRDVDHRLVFAAAPYLPGQIEVVNKSAISMDAYAVLDGRLLVVPLEQGENGFRGIFPTPLENASYYLVSKDRSGRASSTRTYEVQNSCSFGTGSLDGGAPSPGEDARPGLIKRAYRLNSEIRQLEFVDSILHGLAPK